MNLEDSIHINICSSCERVHPKNNDDCYYCHCSINIKKISRFGILHSFTQIPTKMTTKVENQVLVLVDMNEGIKILGELENNFPEQVSIGMKMEIVSMNEKFIFALGDEE